MSGPDARPATARAAPLAAALLAAGLAASLVGCAGNPAPKGLLDPAEASGRVAWGGWIEAELRRDAACDHVTAGRLRPATRDSAALVAPGVRPDWRRLRLEGEFAAVGPDSLYVLTRSGLVAAALADVEKARVTAFDAGTGHLSVWAGVGALSTLSHGVALVFTLPMWIGFGLGATSANEGQARHATGKESWAELRAWARFPPGLPPGVRRGELRLRAGDAGPDWGPSRPSRVPERVRIDVR